jgi:prephenate dehydrogenase
MRVAVIGVGLIGGSIASAARERLGASVSGMDRDPAVLEVALRRGLIDRACQSLVDAVDGAQAAFVAVPVGGLSATVRATLEVAGDDCVVSDVGSTKRAVTEAFGADARFVGGHPLAGTELSGPEHARADLFAGATWYLTPAADSLSSELFGRLRALIEGMGARVEAIDAEDHDRLVASISHLPHVLANALVCEARAAVLATGRGLSATGPSLRDATRVAGAPGAIWTDIYLQNADLLAAAIERAVASLEQFRGALEASDAERIAAFNEAAAAARRELFSS